MKLCPYPFSRMQTKNNELLHVEKQGAFFPCCPSWHTDEYMTLDFEENLDTIWNGKVAQDLRKRMYEGDYSYCKRVECKIPLFTVEELSNPDFLFLETPISPENLEAIKQKNPIMPSNPSSLHLVADMRCNLKCPTCRPELLSNKEDSITAEEEFTFVHKIKKDIEIIKMSSSGEVFYSQAQRKLLKSFNPDEFPKLRRVHLVSNGTLFNQKTFSDLLPGTLYIKDVSISIDAGSKEIYEKIRGPYWEQLKQNLIWISQMRQEGRFDYFSLNFTLIKDNYRDIPALIELGRNLKVDRILIQKYINSPKQGYKTEEERVNQAIHLTTHPEHLDMVEILLRFKNEKILYTTIDIPGFEHKIENHVNYKKAIAICASAKETINNNLLSDALKLTLESLAIEVTSIGLETLVEVNLANAEKCINELNFKDALVFTQHALEVENKYSYKIETINIKEHILLFIENKIFRFQESSFWEKVVLCFNLLSEISTITNQHIFYSAGISFKNLMLEEDALVCFQKSLEINPLHRGSLTEVYNNAKAFNNFEEAIQKLILIYNNSEDGNLLKDEISYLYYTYGLFLKSQDKHNESIDAFQKSLTYSSSNNNEEINKQLYYIYKDKALSYKNESDFEEAIKKLILIDSGSEDDNSLKDEISSLYYMYGLFVKSQGKLNDSINAFQKALTYSTSNSKEEINKQLYYIYKDKAFIHKEESQLDAANDLFLKAVEHDKLNNSNEIFVQLYYIYLDKSFRFLDENKEDEAIENFYLALKYAYKTNEEETVEFIKKAQYYLNRTIGFKKQKKGLYLEAANAFSSALENNEGDLYLYFSYGVSLKRQKKYIDAKIFFNKLLLLNPFHYYGLLEIGFIETLEENYDTALSYLMRANEVEPLEKKGFSDKYIRLVKKRICQKK